MADTPAVTADGFCTNTAPVPGTIRTVNAKNTGPKFFHLHGRRYVPVRQGRVPDRAGRPAPPQAAAGVAPTDVVPVSPREAGTANPARAPLAEDLPPRRPPLPFGERGAPQLTEPPRSLSQ
ncbi:hypothetical protein ACWC3Y_30470 [Streptomyces sp. NPDC001296]